jgi:hypothetical protein
LSAFVAKRASRIARFWCVHIDAIEGRRDVHEPGGHHAGNGGVAATMSQPVKIGDGLDVRNFGRCILCYKCGDACGTRVAERVRDPDRGRSFDFPDLDCLAGFLPC